MSGVLSSCGLHAHLKREYCPCFSVPLRELGYGGQTKKTHRYCSVCSFFLFFFKWRGKIFIFKLSFFFCPVWINMLFVIKWLFFLFVHSVSQANADTLNALNVPHVGKKRKSKKKLNWCLFFFSQCQMLDYWTCIHGGELTIWGGEYLCQTCEILQQSFTTFKGLVAVW